MIIWFHFHQLIGTVCSQKPFRGLAIFGFIWEICGGAFANAHGMHVIGTQCACLATPTKILKKKTHLSLASIYLQISFRFKLCIHSFILISLCQTSFFPFIEVFATISFRNSSLYTSLLVSCFSHAPRFGE